MRKTLLATIAGLALAGAWTRVNTELSMQPESRLWFEGTSTTKSWSCEAKAVDADLVATNASAAAAILGGEKALTSALLKIEMPKIDCGNGTMTGHALKALKAQEHKVATFRVTGYELARATGATNATINGTLTLGGVTKPVVLTAKATDAGAGKLRVAGTYDLKMTDYGLKPPSLMMGAMKVRDEVKVNFDVVLKATQPVANQ